MIDPAALREHPGRSTSGFTGSGRLVLGLFACVCLLGCNGVGRALVDQRPVHDPGKELCGEPVPTCTDLPMPATPSGLPPEAEPVDLQICGATSICPTSVRGLTGGDPAVAGSCETTLTTGHEQGGFDALAQRYCASLRILDEGEPGVDSLLELEGVQLQSVNVTIETKRPLTLRLGSASLLHVWFELRGPITLRIEASRELTDLRVSTPDPSLGRAAVFFENVNANSLALGSAEATFSGELVMRRSSMHRGTLHVAAIELESVSFQDARIEADSLQATDATMARVVVSAERTVFAGSSVTALRMLDCTDFSAVGGELKNSRIDGCANPVRLYGGSFSEGVLDGPVVLDDASLSHVRLGLREPASIQAWDSDVDHVRFCSPRQSISFGGASSVACVRCEGTAVDACIARDGTYDSLGGPEACAPLVEPAACADPQPLRMRPPR